MTKISKAEFLAELPIIIDDNTSGNITPSDHRSVETNMADSVGWLEILNLWEALQKFAAGTLRPQYTLTGSGSVTIATTINDIIIPSGISTVNLPSSPSDGQWYDLKNAAGAQVTLSGNGKNIYTSSDNASRNIISGGSYKVYFDSTSNKWYNK